MSSTVLASRTCCRSFFFFSSRRRHTRCSRDWSSDVCSSDLFEFLRNSALDARNFFDSAKPPFHRNQFGASAGGPIRKDGTYIFGDYEGLRQSLGVTQVDTVPSSAARAGNLSAGAVAADPNVLRFV